MKVPNYYATLGVDKNATADDIKKSYRRLARKYHPDVSQEPDAANQMALLNEANDVLSDPTKRKAYDQVGHQAWAQGARSADDVTPPPGWNQGYAHSGQAGQAGQSSYSGSGFGAEHSEFFEELFGRAAHERSRHQSYQAGQGPNRWDGQDQHAELSLTIKQAYQGTQTKLQLSGYQVDANGHVVPQMRTLEVTIPAGVAQGQLIRLSGQGGQGFGGGQAGDLYLKVHIQPDQITEKDYKVDGRDVTMPLYVTPWEAALGSEIEIKTPAGSPSDRIAISIPAGSVANRKLRIKGKGIPAGKSTSTHTPQAGDLYVELKIAIPSAVTEQQKQAWQALAQSYPGFNPR